MTEMEFKDGFNRLTENFGKQDAGKFRFLYQELRSLDTPSWKKCVQGILDSELRFPVLAVFRKHISSEERTASGTISRTLPGTSCLRCTQGLCSVERYQYRRKHSFSFRCSCPSGDRYPGLPLVGSTRTIKESRRVGENPEPLTVEEKRRALDHHFKEDFSTNSVLDQERIFT